MKTISDNSRNSCQTPDPEEAMQERGDWFADLVMLVFTFAPLLPLAIYCAAMALTAIAIIISHFLIS